VEHLKKVTLELCGKSPVVIFDDADLNAGDPRMGCPSDLRATPGHACVCGSRIFLPNSVSTIRSSMALEHGELDQLGGNHKRAA